ncbi:unnamed protein product [Rhizoctonia solani]|uniref:Uncharacterized protein n=1 Tax=Rhizoctonia solani TaxID=456999 RepID=A0A8H3HP72_9AGAM|nr:unnamed protein product [Rhizoctonia solani]
MSDDDLASSWTNDSDVDDWVDGPSLPHREPDPELIKAYYTAYIGLLRGSSSRRAIPPELVLYICRLAEFECWYTKRAPKGHSRVYASNANVRSLIWIQTEPFTKEMLTRVKDVRLITMSHHQGWVGDRNAGSWSWFELQLARPIGHMEVKRRPDGGEMSWCCLEHPVDEETAHGQGDFAEHKGSAFDSNHELWNLIEEGDVLQVVMKAQFGGWSNTASDGILIISTWWEPSFEMLRLMDRNNGYIQSQ